jgi:transcription initiation factor IIF auxiliary subunit
MSIQIVEIDFEVGHSSIIRSEPTTAHNPPRTHDWKIFLRSADIHGDLSCLINRCIFHLHPEYPNHKRGKNIYQKKNFMI